MKTFMVRLSGWSWPPRCSKVMWETGVGGEVRQDQLGQQPSTCGLLFLRSHGRVDCDVRSYVSFDQEFDDVSADDGAVVGEPVERPFAIESVE